MTEIFFVDETGVIRNEDGEIVSMLDVLDNPDAVIETLDTEVDEE